MFLKESVLVEGYEKGCTAESILESLIEFQESFEEAKYEIIQLEYEKTMLESSQEYLMEAEEEKSAEEGKESLKDKAKKLGGAIGDKASGMKASFLAFIDKLMAKIKGAFFAILAKGEKSWDSLAEATAKKEKVSIVKDAAFGKALIIKINQATSENIDEALKGLSELTGTKEEMSGSEAASVIKARKALIANEAKSTSSMFASELTRLKSELSAAKDGDGAKVSELKAKISKVASLSAKKVSAYNQINVKLFSASK